MTVWWELARATLPIERKQDNHFNTLHYTFKEVLETLTDTLATQPRPNHTTEDLQPPTTVMNKQLNDPTNDAGDTTMLSPTSAVTKELAEPQQPPPHQPAGDTSLRTSINGAPVTQRNLNSELNAMTPAGKKNTLGQNGMNYASLLTPSVPEIDAPDPFTLPSLTPQGATQTETGQVPQLTEATKLNEELFKTNFGNPSKIEDQQAILQSQIVELLRREASNANDNAMRDNNLGGLLNRQTNVEKQMQVLDSTVNVLKEQVVSNTGTLDQHNLALNRQERSLETVLDKLEKMKIESDKKQDAILSEVRKGNEALTNNPKAAEYPPLHTQVEVRQQETQSKKPQNRRGWEQEWIPVNDDELKQLVDREDPVRRLINHNLQGLTTLYFVREKQGSIGMVRSLIERQLELGRVIKGLNFIGDDENEVTEIITTTKHGKAIIAANDNLLQMNAKKKVRRNILGPFIQECNPYSPIWTNLEEMSPQQRVSRTAHHIRKLVNQWYQCAIQSKNEDVQQYYREKLQRATTTDKPLWTGLVHSIEVDDSMQSAPKVYSDAQADQSAGAQKRKARAQNGPVGYTPNSAERKPKERRQRTRDHPDTDEIQAVENEAERTPMEKALEEMETEEAIRSSEPFTAVGDTTPPTLPKQNTTDSGQQPASTSFAGSSSRV